MLEVNVEPGEGYQLIRLVGEIDSYTVGQFRDAMSGIEDLSRVVIDLSEVPFMDSKGLGGLIFGIRRVREADGAVSVISTTASLNRLLNTTGFDRIVTVCESLEDAIAALDED